MPSWIITDPKTGKKKKVTGDTPPTEAELEQLFADSPEPTAPAPAVTGYTPEGPSASDFLTNAAGDALDTAVGAVKGGLHLAAVPFQMIEGASHGSMKDATDPLINAGAGIVSGLANRAKAYWNDVSFRDVGQKLKEGWDAEGPRLALDAPRLASAFASGVPVGEMYHRPVTTALDASLVGSAARGVAGLTKKVAPVAAPWVDAVDTSAVMPEAGVGSSAAPPLGVQNRAGLREHIQNTLREPPPRRSPNWSEPTPPEPPPPAAPQEPPWDPHAADVSAAEDKARILKNLGVEIQRDAGGRVRTYKAPSNTEPTGPIYGAGVQATPSTTPEPTGPIWGAGVKWPSTPDAERGALAGPAEDPRFNISRSDIPSGSGLSPSQRAFEQQSNDRLNHLLNDPTGAVDPVLAYVLGKLGLTTGRQLLRLGRVSAPIISRYGPSAMEAGNTSRLAGDQ